MNILNTSKKFLKAGVCEMCIRDRNKINWRVPKGMELTELDKKVLYYQDRGHLVPSRELIKTCLLYTSRCV